MSFSINATFKAGGKPDYVRAWDDLDKLSVIEDFEQAWNRAVMKMSNLSIAHAKGRSPKPNSTNPVLVTASISVHVIHGAILQNLEPLGVLSMSLVAGRLDSTDFCWFKLPTHKVILPANDELGDDGGDPAVRESAIEKYLVRRLREHFRGTQQRGVIKKIGGPGWRGWPDRMVLFEGGETHWLELKRPKGGKYEPLQLRCHRNLRRMGYVVHVVNTKALVDAYIHELQTVRRL